ncbi:uncharacterized protein PAC_19923 [Phialocephala subalpina]|uniref:AMP-dependent synthetase/ligase domain-containing protein n=1 Tax=Phialocephala subalpina TaxID=576137 RepID=A0A1L7XY69_9HELO|nr:uncharacterized protein PAC_19923 [Phialocephala subalpina]
MLNTPNTHSERGAAEVNFGPNFRYPPPEYNQQDGEVDMAGNNQPIVTELQRLRAVGERYGEQIVEDIVYDIVDEVDFWMQEKDISRKGATNGMPSSVEVKDGIISEHPVISGTNLGKHLGKWLDAGGRKASRLVKGVPTSSPFLCILILEYGSVRREGFRCVGPGSCPVLPTPRAISSSSSSQQFPTGVPKPIYLRNGFMSVWDSWNNIFSRHHPRKISYQHMINARTLTTCALQWLAGLAFSLSGAVFIGMTTVMLPPDMNMTPSLDKQAIMNICKHTGAESILMPPSLIEDFYTDEVAFDFLKSQKYVCYLGAGLDHKKSYEFVPEMGHRFELVTDEICELYVDRTSESSLFQCGFYTFPHLDTINTEELYSPTVDKNGTKRWISRGRKDDLVKLSWLAKFHATHIEDAIARHPQVAAVVVGGEGRHPHMFVDEIYNTVIYGINEKDNDEIRIPREMVMLSDPDLTFKRTMKMTIMRKEVERMYENHINTLYLNSGTKKMNGGAVNRHKEGIKV